MLKTQPPISDLRSPITDADACPCGITDPSKIRSGVTVIDPSTQKPRPTTRPTPFGDEATRIADTEAGARLIAKVVREVLGGQRFEQADDLRDAVEDRCASLGLSFTRVQVERALDLVGSNTQLLAASRRVAVSRPVTAAQEPPSVRHADAKGILQGLGIDVSGGRFQRSSAPSKAGLEPL